MSDTEMFVVFGWLLQPDESALAKTWIASIVGGIVCNVVEPKKTSKQTNTKLKTDQFRAHQKKDLVGPYFK